MKKTHKVVMLPTEKTSDIYLRSDKNLLEVRKVPISGICKPQHLYIISDDEIKEGDWYYSPETKQVYNQSNHETSLPCKKIVATTDKSLEVYNDNGIAAMKGLPQIPESFIQAYIKAYNEGKPITEVDLEMDGDESPAWSGMWKYWPKTRSDNTVIVHQSKMYSRDEMEKAYREGFKDGLNKVHRASEWIEDNL